MSFILSHFNNSFSKPTPPPSPPPPGPKVAIGTFVRRQSDGYVLLGRRKKVAGDGYWTLPGGHLEFGETFEEGASREVLEETGLRVHTPKLLTAKTCFGYASPNAPSSGSDTDKDIEAERRVANYHYVALVLEAYCVDEDPQVQNPEPDKCHGWVWAKWEDVRNSEVYRPLFSALGQVAEDPSFDISPHQPLSKR